VATFFKPGKEKKKKTVQKNAGRVQKKANLKGSDSLPEPIKKKTVRGKRDVGPKTNRG